jgi:ribosomal protein S18 acetylase RimI-like enzyme
VEIVAADEIAQDRLRTYVIDIWHADFVVAHGEQIRPADLPGYVGLDGDRIAGHAAYRIVGDACELVAIAAAPRYSGIGSLLLDAVIGAAREAGCTRVWLTTTNDNLDALRFYQRRGFGLCALRPGVLVEARRTLKPDLPPTGAYDIPMRDDLDLELALEPRRLRPPGAVGILATARRPREPR